MTVQFDYTLRPINWLYLGLNYITEHVLDNKIWRMQYQQTLNYDYGAMGKEKKKTLTGCDCYKQIRDRIQKHLQP